MFMKEENENRELNFFQNLLIFSAFCVILRDFQNTGIRHNGHPALRPPLPGHCCTGEGWHYGNLLKRDLLYYEEFALYLTI